MRRPFLVAAFTLCLASPAVAKLTVLEDFEQAESIEKWEVSLGAEFPGAEGALTRVADSFGGHAGRLTYDFTCTGVSTPCDPRYVAALRWLNPAVTASAVALTVRSAEAAPVLRVMDSTGQTLQFPGTRLPLEARELAAPYRLVFDVTKSASFWGGENDGVLHPPVRSIVLIADRAGIATKGFLEFDDVVLADGVDELSVGFSLDALEWVTLPTTSEQLGPRLGVNIHFTSDDRALDAIARAEISWVRMDLAWAGVERAQGLYDFSAFDSLLDALDQRKLRALFILDYGNPHYTGGPMLPPRTSEAVRAFGNYVEAAAKHFMGRNVVFEVWNEPDLDGFWGGNPNVEEYIPVLREGIARAYAGDPNALVLTGGLSSPGSYQYGFFRRFLDAGAAEGAHGLGTHLYIWDSPEHRWPDVLRLRALVADKLPGRDVWCTEWGFSSTRLSDSENGHDPTARRRQAVAVVREVLTAWTAGLPLNVIYDIRDDCTNPTDAECNFGLLQHDYADKPAMVALRQLTSVAAARRLTALGTHRNAPPGLHVARLEGLTDSVLVVWTQGITVTLPLPALALDVRDLSGEPLSMANGSVRVTPEDGPVYVRVRASVTDGGGAAGTDRAVTRESVRPSASGGCGCLSAHRSPSPLVLSALLGAVGCLMGRRSRRM